MRLKVLVDNNTLIDNYYYGEPAVCLYIEDGREKILFDTGYSGLFMENAAAMGVDLTQISTVIISHGHNDHTGGLRYLMNPSALKILAHPHAFNEKESKGVNISSPMTAEELKKRFDLTLTKESVRVSDNLYYLGEIPTVLPFETREPIGHQKTGGAPQPDYVLDDTALAYKSPQGIYIITGCSHSGICNIIERAKAVCSDNRVLGVFGGFHLFDVTPKVVETVEYFINNNIGLIYPCHCVSFKVKSYMDRFLDVRETGVGMEINW